MQEKLLNKKWNKLYWSRQYQYSKKSVYKIMQKNKITEKLKKPNWSGQIQYSKMMPGLIRSEPFKI